MKKAVTFFLIIILASALAGCKGEFKISCNNESTYKIYVTGDQTGSIDSGSSVDFFVKSGGCLTFNGVKTVGTTTSSYSFGSDCFDSDNKFTFHEPVPTPTPLVP